MDVLDKIMKRLEKQGQIFDLEFIRKSSPDFYEGIGIVDFLCGDSAGQFITTSFLSRVIDISQEEINDMLETEYYYDWEMYTLFPYLTELIGIDGVFVDYAEGGLAILKVSNE